MIKKMYVSINQFCFLKRSVLRSYRSAERLSRLRFGKKLAIQTVILFSCVFFSVFVSSSYAGCNPNNSNWDEVCGHCIAPQVNRTSAACYGFTGGTRCDSLVWLSGNTWEDGALVWHDPFPAIKINYYYYCFMTQVAGRRYYGKLSYPVGSYTCGTDGMPDCTGLQSFIPDCQCGCLETSTDVCRVKPDSATTCDYECPWPSGVGLDGACYINGVKCKDFMCPSECWTTIPCNAANCTVGYCEGLCPSDYEFKASDCSCTKLLGGYEYYDKGIRNEDKNYHEERFKSTLQGGYEIRY